MRQKGNTWKEVQGLSVCQQFFKQWNTSFWKENQSNPNLWRRSNYIPWLEGHLSNLSYLLCAIARSLNWKGSLAKITLGFLVFDVVLFSSNIGLCAPFPPSALWHSATLNKSSSSEACCLYISCVIELHRCSSWIFLKITAPVIELKYWSCGDYVDELYLFMQDFSSTIKVVSIQKSLYITIASSMSASDLCPKQLQW